MGKVTILVAIKKLRQLKWAEETGRIGADSEISDLIQSLENFQPLLTSDDQMPKESVREIEALVYRVEDAVESLAYEFDRSQLQCNILCGVAIQKKSRSGIMKLCTRIRHLLSPDLLQLPHNVNVESSSWDSNRKKWRQIFENELNGEAVGIVEEKEVILRHLLDKSEGCENRFEVIHIWGPSGTGKKTLAHAIRNDPSVVLEFPKHRIVITVSDSFNLRQTFSSLLKYFRGSEEDNKGSPLDILAKEIRGHLEESRSLILLEDVRSDEDWKWLRSAVEAKGSRILVTTRTKEAAEGMIQASYIIQESYIHKKRHLTEKHSWELLKRTAWPEMNPGAEIGKEMETKGLEMVKKCEGLPGPIIELAKLVADKDASEWESVQRNARSDLSQVMTPSYDELSDELKLCFIYLGHFREDPEVETEKLCHLWTIEGLISPQECINGMTLLEKTHENLKVLAQKGMIDLKD